VRTIRIGDRNIGSEAPVFIVAEVGTTSNGDIDTALKLVDAAKAAGVDAIKFMILGPDEFMSDKTVTYEYDWAGGHHVENMYEMFKNLMFTHDEWLKIRDHCKARGILFYATVDYLSGVELAESLDVPAYKLSSWDITNFPLIEKMAATKKPIQLDLGPASLSDIEKAVKVIHSKENDDVILVHCSHAVLEEGAQLRSIPYLRGVFQIPVGYSADSLDTVPDIAAVAMGACMIEKRLTLNRGYFGHHHVNALEPSELSDYVKTIRRVERMSGDYGVYPSPEDLRQKDLYYVSIVAAEDIPAGAEIVRHMLACKRPGTGISPEFLDILVGRQAKRDISCNTVLTWEHV